MTNKILLIIGVILLVISMAFIFQTKKSELVNSKLTKDIDISLLRVDNEKYAKMMNETLESYKGYFIYLLKLENINGSGSPIYLNVKSDIEYGTRVSYFSEEIRNDIFLIQGQDTLNCVHSHWERTYNLRPDMMINLVFKSKNDTVPNKFIWNDKIFTGIPKRIKLN